jgi:hypothetical protein
MWKVSGKGLIYYITYLTSELHFGFLINNLWDQRAREKHEFGVRTTDYCLWQREYIRQLVPKYRLLEFKACSSPVLPFFIE